MRSYLLRRALLTIPTLFFVTLAAFAVGHRAPGDAAVEYLRRVRPGLPPTHERLVEARRELGLDRPFPTQYASWLGNLARGDLGRSYSTRRPVVSELADRVPATLALTIPAALVVLALAVPAGVFAATRRNRLPDHLLRLLSMAAICMPTFWLALLLVQLLAVKLSLVPVAGRAGASSMVLPILAMAVAPAGVLARLTRAAVLDTLGQDYVRTARAKGVPERSVVTVHALRNALLPLVTAFTLIVGAFVTGDVVVETIFSWPGAGRFARDAVLARDYPVIAGFVLFAGAGFLVLNLLTDLSYAAVDPRVSLDCREGAR